MADACRKWSEQTRRARAHGAWSWFRFTGRSRNESRERWKRMGDQRREDVVYERVHCGIYHHARPHGPERRLAFLEPDPRPDGFTRTEDRSRRKENGIARFPHPCSDL